MTHLLRALAALLVACACAPALAQPNPTTPAAASAEARLERWLADLDRAQLAMGSMALLRGDAPPWLRSVGHARLAEGAAPPEPATANTRYRIGSISKLMTAVMVLQLADEGRLALDEPIARWFPTLPEAGRTTVAHLLAHRSGLGDIKDLPGFDRHWMFEPRAEPELLAAITSLPRAFAPGVAAQYNNSGYLLLSFIVEKAGGEPYAQALQRRLAQPLGLADTAFDARSGVKPGEAASYRSERGPEQFGPAAWQLQRATHASVAQGAGGVVSSPRDLVVLVRALFQGRLLKPETLARMRQVQDGFGLGLVRIEGLEPAAWGHEGTIDGSSSVVAYVPALDTALAWTGNAHRLPREVLARTLWQAASDARAVLPTYAAVQATVAFSVEAPAATGAAPEPISLRGNATPLSWQRNWPLQYDAAQARWNSRVTLTLRDGVPLEYKYLRGAEGWERTPNRVLALAGGATAAVADQWELDAERSALRQAVLAEDTRLFDAFNRGDVATMGTIFSPRLEFFHDRTGLTGHAENLRLLAQNTARSPAPRRERVPGSDEVIPLGRFGALHQGVHRFCTGTPPQAECGRYRFSHVWERTEAGWQLLRVISIDH